MVKSTLNLELKYFSVFGLRLWSSLRPDWPKPLKRAFKRLIQKLSLTVIGIEDGYVDAHSLNLKFNTSNYCAL